MTLCNLPADNGFLRDWSGTLVENKPVECPDCGHKNNFTIYYYINGSACREFEQQLRSHDRETYTCKRCGVGLRIRAPLIVDLPERDLLIFATNGGDDAGVDSGFHRFFEKLRANLPDDVVLAIRTRPYTFVHGRKGLLALLDHFKGQSTEPSNSNLRIADDRFEIVTYQGYRYGDLFFFFPGHLSAQALIGMVVSAALDLEAAGRAKAGILLLQGVIERIGDAHPWLMEALGRLLVTNGQVTDAETCLIRALERRHSWYAVTCSFLDATPVRRSDVEVQSTELPYATRHEQLGSITLCRHTVTGMKPAFKDVGLWDFPIMEQASIPKEYTLENLLSGYAYGLGLFDRYLFHELQPGYLSEASQVGWHKTQEASRELLQCEGADQSSYWGTYVEARWQLDLHSDTLMGAELSSAAQVAEMALNEIKRTLSMVPEELHENPFMFFSKGYSASDVRFFLTGAAAHIRHRLLRRVKDLPPNEAELHRASLCRSVDELAEESCSAFDHASSVAELVDSFKVFVPRIVRLLTASLGRANEQATSDLRLLENLQTFESLFGERLTPDNIEFLSIVKDNLRGEATAPLGQLLKHFITEAQDQEREVDALTYCHYRMSRDRCPVCLEDAPNLVWDIINICKRPDLEKLVRCGKALIPYCRTCLAPMPRKNPLLYSNPGADLYLLFCPDLDEPGEKHLQAFVEDYVKMLPLEFRANKPGVLFSSEYVSKWNNADEYVVIARVRSSDEFMRILKDRL